MQINLRENEIGKAVELYLKHHGIKLRGLDVTVQFSMGKGANGLRAEVNIEGLDQRIEIPGFTDRDREVEIPLQLLDTLVLEPEVRPGTIGAAIKHHSETIGARIERALTSAEDTLPAVEQTVEVTEVEHVDAAPPPWEAAEQEVVIAAEPSLAEAGDDVGLEVPVEVEAPDHPAELAPTPEPEPVVEAAPEPVVEAAPVRRPIFGNKKLAAVPQAEVEAEPASLIPASAEITPEVVAQLAAAPKTGPVRRTSALFKKTPA